MRRANEDLKKEIEKFKSANVGESGKDEVWVLSFFFDFLSSIASSKYIVLVGGVVFIGCAEMEH